MSQNIDDFKRRMKMDRFFRYKMLAAWKSGNLSDAMLGEGYTFSIEKLKMDLPRVNTGLRAGGCGCHCKCGIREDKY